MGRGCLGRLKLTAKQTGNQEHVGKSTTATSVGKIKIHNHSNNVTIILKARPGDNLVGYGMYSVLPPPPYEPRRQG